MTPPPLEKPLMPLEHNPDVRDRVTAHVTLHHEQVGVGPTTADHMFQDFLENVDEQPYTRVMKVGVGWQPLEFGWLAGKVGLIAVQNGAGKNLRTHPTEEEKVAIKATVLEIAAFENGRDTIICIVRAGRFTVFEYPAPETLRIRTRDHSAKITITAIPR